MAKKDDNNAQERKYTDSTGNFAKGNPGRPKGAKNKITQKMREGFAMVAENNLDNLEKWIAQIAADDPKEAMKIFLNLSEFLLPKLSRSEQKIEHTGQDKSIEIKIVRKEDKE